jgi:hypothetical protein
VDDDYVDEFMAISRGVMESIAKERLSWDLPFTVDIGYGETWAAAK